MIHVDSLLCKSNIPTHHTIPPPCTTSAPLHHLTSFAPPPCLYHIHTPHPNDFLFFTDPVLIMCLTDRIVSPIAKSTLFDTPVLGWLMKGLKGIAYNNVQSQFTFACIRTYKRADWLYSQPIHHIRAHACAPTYRMRSPLCCAHAQYIFLPHIVLMLMCKERELRA